MGSLTKGKYGQNICKLILVILIVNLLISSVGGEKSAIFQSSTVESVDPISDVPNRKGLKKCFASLADEAVIVAGPVL